MDELIDRAAGLFRAAKRVCVLTGAGVSAESGVPTFRASDGLWEGHRIEDVATPEGWARDPSLVWQFYHARRATAGSVKPNPGHFALAALERHFGADRFTLATQNVDGLHRAAGSTNVLELHGSLRRTRCTGCGAVEDRGLEPLAALPDCPACGGRLRPDIVWFGEMLDPDVLEAAQTAAMRCDLFLVAGTSAVVYPAAGLISIASAHRGYKDAGRAASVVEVNLAESAASSLADVSLQGPSGVVLPRLCERLGIH